jgi:hypothetical protein
MVNARAVGVVHAIRRRPVARQAVAPRRACDRLSQPPFPRPAPQGTSAALPYCILRRMSTDEHGAAPVWAGAVLVVVSLGRVERTPPVFRRALCSLLLPPCGTGSVTIFRPAPLCASPSQKPACRHGSEGGEGESPFRPLCTVWVSSSACCALGRRPCLRYTALRGARWECGRLRTRLPCHTLPGAAR